MDIKIKELNSAISAIKTIYYGNVSTFFGGLRNAVGLLREIQIIYKLAKLKKKYKVIDIFPGLDKGRELADLVFKDKKTGIHFIAEIKSINSRPSARQLRKMKEYIKEYAKAHKISPKKVRIAVFVDKWVKGGYHAREKNGVKFIEFDNIKFLKAKKGIVLEQKCLK